MRLARAVAASAVALALAAPAAIASVHRCVLVAIVPSEGEPTPAPATSLLRRFAADPLLRSFALMTASVGSYNEQQTLLDITQGARVPRVDYGPQAPPALTVSGDGDVRDWAAVLRRARSADASIDPGLLASRIPGGAGYAATRLVPRADAVIAAGQSGHIAAVSLGSPASLSSRVARLLARRALVVADLSPGAAGLEELRELVAARRPDELVLAMERPPSTPPRAVRAPVLLALAAAGLSPARGSLSSPTTRTGGLVTVDDLGPTILAWLHRATPAAFAGQAISAGAPRSLASFASFEERLGVIARRRSVVLLAFVAAWALLLAGALALRRGLRGVLRLGGLAALWTPSTALLAAALEPSAASEIAVVVGGALILATATDRLAGWPRAAAIPAGVALLAYTIDLARGSRLIETSVLGSNPIAGSRFFGVGNELSAVLPVLLFAALAAVLPQRPLTRREIACFAFGGALLTLVVAWGRMGANVGGVFTVGGGTAIATLIVLPGSGSLRRLALGLLALLVLFGLVALADLATGGGAHFTREVLHAHSLGALLATLGRRLSEAWNALFVGHVLVAVLICVVGGALAVRYRARLLAPVGAANAWAACLGGGLGGSVLGSLAADSGPRLFLVGCFTLLCVLGYVWGSPARAPDAPAERPFLSDA
jgi:hypothetical protein